MLLVFYMWANMTFLPYVGYHDVLASLKLRFH